MRCGLGLLLVMLVILGAAHARAQDCDFTKVSQTVEGLLSADTYPTCVESDLKRLSFIAELLAIPANDKVVNEPKVHGALLELAEAMRRDGVLPTELGETWARMLESMVPRPRSTALPKTPSPLSFEQSANSEDSDCGCAWVVGGVGRPGPFVCIASAPALSSSSGCQSPGRYAFRVAQASALRLFSYAYLASHGLTALGRRDRKAVEERLRDARGKWDHLLVRGYTQFPWELPLNSAIADHRQKRLCKDSPTAACQAAELEPFQLQLLFLHPSAALGVTGFGIKHFDPDPKAVVVLNVEVLGVLGYTKTFLQYFGVGASLSLADLNFGTPLLGATIHVTRWIHVGYGASVVPGKSRSDANTLFLGADLFGVLSKWTGLN